MALSLAWTLALALSASPAAKNCPHPFFPIDEALILTYRAGKAELTVRYEKVRRDPKRIRGTLVLGVDNRRGEAGASCSEKGIQTELGGLESAALRMSGLDVKVLRSEGITLPPPNELVEGASW